MTEGRNGESKLGAPQCDKFRWTIFRFNWLCCCYNTLQCYAMLPVVDIFLTTIFIEWMQSTYRRQHLHGCSKKSSRQRAACMFYTGIVVTFYTTRNERYKKRAVDWIRVQFLLNIVYYSAHCGTRRHTLYSLWTTTAAAAVTIFSSARSIPDN